MFRFAKKFDLCAFTPSLFTTAEYLQDDQTQTEFPIGLSHPGHHTAGAQHCISHPYKVQTFSEKVSIEDSKVLMHHKSCGSVFFFTPPSKNLLGLKDHILSLVIVF